MTHRHGGTPPTASRVLRARLALAAPALRAATARLWQPEGLRERYPEYLLTMHEVIRASVPLLVCAGRRCADARHDDQLAAPLGRYFARHAEEEAHHDEWLLADLAELGLATGDGPRFPSPAVARLVGAQYYWIEHHHPVALLGYMAVLEGNAPSTGLAPHIARATGFPASALRTVRAHAEADVGHTAELDTVLDSLVLTESQRSALAISALHTADGLLDLFGRITESTGGAAPRTRAATGSGPPTRTFAAPPALTHPGDRS